jgi:hypothetical protein
MLCYVPLYLMLNHNPLLQVGATRRETSGRTVGILWHADTTSMMSCLVERLYFQCDYCLTELNLRRLRGLRFRHKGNCLGVHTRQTLRIIKIKQKRCLKADKYRAPRSYSFQSLIFHIAWG